MTQLKRLSAIFLTCCLAACGGGREEGAPPAPPPPPPPPSQTLPDVVGGTARLLAGSLSYECGDVNKTGALTVHAGAVWLADTSCTDGSARVQAIDLQTGAVRLHASAAPSLPGDARAKGFGYPTGIVFDSKDNLFVMDGANFSSKFRSGFPGMTPTAGHASGIWKIQDQGMTVFAGVMLNKTEDGVGESAGFMLANGLTRDASDNLYTRDYNTLRKITPQAMVTTIAQVVTSLATPPVVDDKRHRVYLTARTAGVYSLIDVESGDKVSDLPGKTDMVQLDLQNRIYSAELSNGDNDPVVIYRGTMGGADFEPVVTNVRYLGAMAVDEDGNLYLHQNNAIVKVEFAR